jgi:hypothetical protein
VIFTSRAARGPGDWGGLELERAHDTWLQDTVVEHAGPPADPGTSLPRSVAPATSAASARHAP